MERILKSISMFLCVFCLFISGLFVSASFSKKASAASSIIVQNETNYNIEVSINRWSIVGGSTAYYQIKPNTQESWSRSDERRFLVAVRRNNQVERYIVRTDSLVRIINYDYDTGSGAIIGSIPLKSQATTPSNETSNSSYVSFVNNSNYDIYVSVNTWGGGNTGRYLVRPGASETWERSDTRGHVMNIDLPTQKLLYLFVLPGQVIVM